MIGRTDRMKFCIAGNSIHECTRELHHRRRPTLAVLSSTTLEAAKSSSSTPTVIHFSSRREVVQTSMLLSLNGAKKTKTTVRYYRRHNSLKKKMGDRKVPYSTCLQAPPSTPRRRGPKQWLCRAHRTSWSSNIMWRLLASHIEDREVSLHWDIFVSSYGTSRGLNIPISLDFLSIPVSKSSGW